MNNEQDNDTALTTSPQGSSGLPSRSAGLSPREVVVKVAGMSSIVALAVLRVFPTEAWPWMLGGIVIQALPAEVIRLLAQGVVERLPWGNRR
jgi:hypothetical protein